MKNLKIEEFRKITGQERCADGVYRQRTRPFVRFKCFHCNDIAEATRANYSDDKPCKECSKRLRGKANFLRRAYEKFGDKFDLTKAEQEYFDATTPVTIKCNIHNIEYKISPTRFVAKAYNNQPAKGGCPKCAYEIQLTKNKQSIDHYLSIIEEWYPNISVVSHGNADNNLEIITLSCPIHGEFTKTLARVKSSTYHDSCLCPLCTAEKHAWRSRMVRTDIPGKVYFVKFKDVNLYKCGVTYKTTKERLRGHVHNIDILWELDFPTLSDAYTFEVMFFREYHKLRTNHPDHTLGGYTEFFCEEIQKPLQPFVTEMLRQKNLKRGNP